MAPDAETPCLNSTGAVPPSFVTVIVFGPSSVKVSLFVPENPVPEPVKRIAVSESDVQKLSPVQNVELDVTTPISAFAETCVCCVVRS